MSKDWCEEVKKVNKVNPRQDIIIQIGPTHICAVSPGLYQEKSISIESVVNNSREQAPSKQYSKSVDCLTVSFSKRIPCKKCNNYTRVTRIGDERDERYDRDDYVLSNVEIDKETYSIQLFCPVCLYENPYWRKFGHQNRYQENLLLQKLPRLPTYEELSDDDAATFDMLKSVQVVNMLMKLTGMCKNLINLCTNYVISIHTC